MDDLAPSTRTLREVSGLVHAKGEAVLQELYGDAPVLLVRPVSEGPNTLLVGTTPDGSPTEKFQTDDMNQTQERPALSEYPPLGQGTSLVVPVAKSERNPFVGLITVGRAANNDVILSTPNVSKLHAFITRKPEGWLVEDRDSTNGTMVDGVLLEPKTQHRLELGSEVTFGGVGGLFVHRPQLASLCRMVKSEAE